MLLQYLLGQKGLAGQFYEKQSHRLQLVVDRSRNQECSPSDFDFVAVTQDLSTNSSEFTATYLTMLQLPLFDMLRFIFTNYCKSSKYGVSSNLLEESETTTLLLAVDLWLLYIQPWTASLPGSSIANGQSKSLVVWRPFIAANLHFYTTLWACYMNMIARVNLLLPSTKRHLQYLKKVLQAYSGESFELLRIVDELHGRFKSWYSRSTSVVRPPQNGSSYEYRSPRHSHREGSNSGASLALEGNGELYSMAWQHQSLFIDRSIDRLLGDSGIYDLRMYSLESCSQLVYSLHEVRRSFDSSEKDSQLGNTLSLLDRIAESILRSIGLTDPPVGVTSQDNLAKQTDSSEIVKLLDFCIDTIVTIIPQSDSGRSSSSSAGRQKVNEEEERKKKESKLREEADEEERHRHLRDKETGKLTDFGRQQVLLGKEKCSVEFRNPEKKQRIPFVYYADPLDLPVCSYESPFLVKFFTILSRSLNSRFLLPKNDKWILWEWIYLLQLGKETDYSGEEGLLKRREFTAAYVLYPTALGLLIMLSNISFGSKQAASTFMIALFSFYALFLAGILGTALRMGLRAFHELVSSKLPTLSVVTVNVEFLRDIFRFNLRPLARARVAAVACFVMTGFISQLFHWIFLPSLGSCTFFVSSYILSSWIAYSGKISY